MQFKHHVEIDSNKVARLINEAAESVDGDLQVFFRNVASMVNENITSLVKKLQTPGL